jgi:hypothetical protein
MAGQRSQKKKEEILNETRAYNLTDHLLKVNENKSPLKHLIFSLRNNWVSLIISANKR